VEIIKVMQKKLQAEIDAVFIRIFPVKLAAVSGGLAIRRSLAGSATAFFQCRLLTKW
jgi:hypothetical protein